MIRQERSKRTSLSRLGLGTVALSLLFLLGACGQKGDLYMPKKQTQLINQHNDSWV